MKFPRTVRDSACLVKQESHSALTQNESQHQHRKMMTWILGVLEGAELLEWVMTVRDVLGCLCPGHELAVL